MSLEQPFTIDSLIHEIRDVLHSYTRSQDQRTSLTSPLTVDGLEFSVSGEVLVSRGLVEIGDELVYASSVDPTVGVATVEPWGRAQSGTTAVAHPAGTEVTMSPLYPRRRLGNIVAGVLREIFPHIFAVDQTELDINPARTNYELPENAFQVLSVEWNWPGPSRMWAPVERWRQNKPTTGLELEVISGTWPGVGRVRVKFAKGPKPDWALADSLTDYGYDHEVRDLVVIGAAARALAFTEPSRLQVQSVESQNRAEHVPAGALTEASRYLYSLFRQRLAEEREQMLLRHPIQPHRNR